MRVWFWREGMDGRVCIERLVSREEVVMAEEGASETEEEVVEVSYACGFCLRSEIVEL